MNLHPLTHVIVLLNTSTSDQHSDHFRSDSQKIIFELKKKGGHIFVGDQPNGMAC